MDSTWSLMHSIFTLASPPPRKAYPVCRASIRTAPIVSYSRGAGNTPERRPTREVEDGWSRDPEADGGCDHSFRARRRPDPSRHRAFRGTVGTAWGLRGGGGDRGGGGLPRGCG